jgi:outer membrane protein TolC
MRPSPLSARLAAVLLLAAFALEAGAEGATVQLDIAKAEELARTKADEVAARNAAAAAALGAVDAARANLLPKLSGSVSGAYLANPPAGVTVKAGSLGTLPLWVPATANPSSPYAGPFVEYPVSMPSSDLTVVPDAKNSYFKGNLTFSQPLFAWGKIRAAIDLASLEAEVASVDARGAALDSARQANKAYYSALLAGRSAAILSELKALAEQIVVDRESALDEGLSTREKLLSAKADLADLGARLVEAREGERSSLEALAFLTGLDASSIELGSDFRDALPAIDEESLKDGAAATSTAFGEAKARLSEARSKLGLERGSGTFKPDLSLFASLDASGQDIPLSSGSWTDTWAWDLSIGLAAKVDLFDGGGAAARRKEASAQVESADAALRATLGALRLEARRALDAARRAEASLVAARARGEWAAEALRQARASAADQMISRQELYGAEIREASERLTVLGAQYALEETIADLDRLGAGASPHAIEGAKP